MIHWCREFLRILVLLRQWAPVTDTRALTSAIVYARPSTLFTRVGSWACPSRNGLAPAGMRSWACPSRNACFGRLLPGFMRALNGLLHEQVGQHNAEIGGGLSATASFQGVPSATPILAASQICCGPHCQCSFLERGRNWVEVEWPGRRGRQRGQGQGSPGQAGRGRSQGRGSRRGPSGRAPKPGHVFAPTWVTKAPVGSVKPHSQDKCGQTLREFQQQPPIRTTSRQCLRCFLCSRDGTRYQCRECGARYCENCGTDKYCWDCRHPWWPLNHFLKQVRRWAVRWLALSQA